MEKAKAEGCKYIDIIISQNTTQFYAQYVQYISQLHINILIHRTQRGCHT